MDDIGAAGPYRPSNIESRNFGTQLRHLRVEAGLTQARLAERAGLSVRGIADLERGVRRFPYAETLERLVQALDLNVAERAALIASARRKRVPNPHADGRFNRTVQGGRLEDVRRFEPEAATVRLHNLPAHLPTLIGREEAVKTIRRLLLDTQAGLLTLTGAGGIGKTRLALAVAADLVEEFADGVWLVELAALTDAALVPQTVAAVFDLRETLDDPIETVLGTILGRRTLLLVLDNCEHLLDGCAQLVDRLLRSCSDLRVLATSRESLGIPGEVAWRVPSLPVADPARLPPLHELRDNAAVRLFVERASDVQTGFILSERNAAAIAQVCHRLDGIPLALELGAARIEALTVQQLAARLDQSLSLLTVGRRTALPRQQTLQATLDWSYNLLSEPERRLFNRLSVFTGGWTLEAVEKICSGDGIDRQHVLDLLQRLVKKSLVVAVDAGDGAERFVLLESVGQYAQERASEAGELETVQSRHATYYGAAFGEATEQHRYGRAWLGRLLAEHDNLRSSLRWLGDHNEVEQAVRLAGPLGDVWVWGGFLTEGRMYLRRLLAMQGRSHTSPDWARLLWTSGLVEFFAGDYAAARARWEETVAVRRMLNDPDLADALSYLGQVAREQEDYASAVTWLEESLSLARATGDQWGYARTLDRLGTIAQALGDYSLARSRYEESLSIARQNDDSTEIAWSLHNLGCLALDCHDYASARDCLAESLKVRMDFDNIGFVHALAELSVLAAGEGRPAPAVRLSASTAALTQKTGIRVQHSERKRYERALASAREELSERVAAAAWAEGHEMQVDQAIAYALAPHEPFASAADMTDGARGARIAHLLTPRQRETAVLIAQGLTNRQIGERLIVTERAAAAHVEHILDKLGIGSRAQIAVWASEHGLLTRTHD